MDSIMKNLFDRGEKILVLMRGISGSGKSHEAQRILASLGGDPHVNILSTDHFWIPQTRQRRKEGITVPHEDELEEYRKNWDGDKVGYAHEVTQSFFKKQIDTGVNPIIIDNTNVRVSDMKPYAEYASKHGYHIFIKEPTSKWWLDNVPYLNNRKGRAKELDKFAELLFNKNSHDVPLKSIQKMIARWKPNVKPAELI